MPPSPPAEDAVVITPAFLRDWGLPLPDQGDKHIRGTVLVVGGSPATPGAVLLAGLAALRAGAGRLQLATSAEVAVGLAIAVPEALVVGLDGDGTGSFDPDAVAALGDRLARADAVVVGPGLDPGPATIRLLDAVLARVGAHTVVVADADALTCLPELDPARLADVAARLVLTPNRSEAAALADRLERDDEPGALAVAVAERFGAVATVHGEVAGPDGRRWSAGAGSIGLGTSGSGDVLAGLIAGVGARCGEAARAAVWGSYLHAAVGERLAVRIGPVGYLAREMLDEVPTVLAELSR